MSFTSTFQYQGRMKFPSFTGLRVQMMPFNLEKPIETLPAYLQAYACAIDWICEITWPTARGIVAYLTIDEAFVRAGETHRRPGLHVDGIGPDGKAGAWGGGGGYGSSGMYVASNVIGCRAWDQMFESYPGPNGDCEHLRPQLGEGFEMKPGHVYHCDGLCVHEAIPMEKDTRRQFMRLSMPSLCDWYEDCTPNPLGIFPAGRILPARKEFMSFRP